MLLGIRGSGPGTIVFTPSSSEKKPTAIVVNEKGNGQPGFESAYLHKGPRVPCICKVYSSYGCKWWAMRVEDERKLEVFDHYCLRTILRVKYSDIALNDSPHSLRKYRKDTLGNLELSVTALDLTRYLVSNVSSKAGSTQSARTWKRFLELRYSVSGDGEQNGSNCPFLLPRIIVRGEAPYGTSSRPVRSVVIAASSPNCCITRDSNP
ncbi:unnamed protein product [Dibothriocephalus latus]|uniref:Uncharacterized protein n=1 Tax=Dibothriocephalus latus TaxID=60516 RepID=A0A3P7M001_DIBLA|nr:unnamed protein product [Dibothriocephalus latus]